MSLEKEKISFSYPIINITAEGARSWGWWKREKWSSTIPPTDWL
jgi:hypothetical protein